MNVPSSNESLFCFPPSPPPPPPPPPPLPPPPLLLQVRCCQYWPEQGTSKEYGKFQVFSQIEQVDRVYVTRRFKLRNNQVHICSVCLSRCLSVYLSLCLSVTCEEMSTHEEMSTCFVGDTGNVCSQERHVFMFINTCPQTVPSQPYIHVRVCIHTLYTYIYGHVCARWYL